MEKQKMIGAGELIQSSWRFYLRHWKLLVGVAAAVCLPLAIVRFFLLQLKLVHLTIRLNYALTLVEGIIGVFITIALINAIDSISRGNQLSIGGAYRLAPSRFWAYILTAILAFIIVCGGVLLFVIPGVIFTVWFAFTQYIVVIERAKGSRALRKSKELVSGHWMKVWWRLAASTITYAIPVGLIYLLILFFIPRVLGGEATLDSLAQDKSTPLLGLLSVIPDILSRPLFLLFPFILYKNLKKIKAEKQEEKLAETNAVTHSA